MKIAITTTGESLESPLESRFGRAPKFLIVELDNNSFEVVENITNMSAIQGAGIQTAQTVVELGVEAVITGHCGPKAFKVLQSAGIKVFNSDRPTIQEAIEEFKAGNLSESKSADVKGHWS